MLLHNQTGRTYPVYFEELTLTEVTQEMNSWEESFDWTLYFGESKPGEIRTYKMKVKNQTQIEGAIALESRQDHVYIHLIESAPHNRNRKIFDLVGEHLIAFACWQSRLCGYGGYVAFQSKSSPRLINYYKQNIGAVEVGSGIMIIDEHAAQKLIMLYLNER